MQTLQALVTGSIQGLSEFLPISSSAHITFSNFLFQTFSGVSPNRHEEIFFDIIVHLATLFAVIIYFYNDLKVLLIDFFKSIKQKNYENENTKLVIYIIVSTLITGIMGLFIKDTTENLIQNPKIITILLFITGLILLLSEKFYKGDKKINLKTAIIAGIAQGFAIFPGFSRSGLTITALMFQGLDRVTAARFSFLMSIPVIFMASLIYPLMELDMTQIASFNIKAIVFGFISSFVVGYLCIKYFMKLLKKLSLRIFGYYCIVVAFCLFLLFQVYYHI